MKEILVDKLPESCKECDLCEQLECQDYYCSGLNKQIAEYCAEYCADDDCPLQLISDHDKEKDEKIKQLEKALELACDELSNHYCPTFVGYNFNECENIKCNDTQKQLKECWYNCLMQLAKEHSDE